MSLIADEIEAFLRTLDNGGEQDFEQLSEFSECVFLKNADGVCIFSNKAHRQLFTQIGSDNVLKVAHIETAAPAW